MENCIPIGSLNDLSENEQCKYTLLADKFENMFKKRPDFFARAPGRVNLIGNKINFS